MPSEKIILDLCGGTGSWSEPYKNKGYKIYNITWPQYDVRDYIVDGDIMEFPYRHPMKPIAAALRIPLKNVHGIFAAPPCTMFSLARRTAKTPPDFEGAMEVVKKCLEIIWAAKTRGNLKFWALENPRGLLRQFIGKPAFSFRVNEFGDPWSKPTDIWGYFNSPKKLKNPVEVPKGNHRESLWYKKTKGRGGNRAVDRSMTAPGFARAFFKANQ